MLNRAPVGMCVSRVNDDTFAAGEMAVIDNRILRASNTMQKQQAVPLMLALLWMRNFIQEVM